MLEQNGLSPKPQKFQDAELYLFFHHSWLVISCSLENVPRAQSAQRECCNIAICQMIVIKIAPTLRNYERKPNSRCINI